MARLPERHHVYESVFNGTGPHAWNQHWLIVPLYGRSGEVIEPRGLRCERRERG